jgi:hypothetical protein
MLQVNVVDVLLLLLCRSMRSAVTPVSGRLVSLTSCLDSGCPVHYELDPVRSTLLEQDSSGLPIVSISSTTERREVKISQRLLPPDNEARVLGVELVAGCWPLAL